MEEPLTRVDYALAFLVGCAALSAAVAGAVGWLSTRRVRAALEAAARRERALIEARARRDEQRRRALYATGRSSPPPGE